MFSVKFTLINMKRSLLKLIIVASVITILIVLLFLYDYILETYQHKLDYIYDNMDLSAAISFTPYTADEDKSIPLSFIEDAQSTGFVKHTYYKMIYDYFTYDDNMLKNNLKLEEIEKNVVALNNSQYFYNSIDQLTLEFIDGYDADKVFNSNEPVCIISVNVARRLSLDMGDTIKVDISKNFLDYDETFIVPFKIVGSYSNKSTDYTLYTSYNYLSESITNENLDYKINEVIFKLTNLRELKKFENYLIDLGLINSNSYLPGMCCSIDSTEFVRSTNEVKKIMSIMESLRITVYSIILFIGFIIAYMYSESKRKSLFIMRSLGTKKFDTFVANLLDNSIVCVIGIIFGMIIFRLFSSIDKQNLIILGLFICVYIIGTVLSLSLMLRKNILAILSVKE